MNEPRTPHEYFVKEAVMFGKEQGYKYCELWADKFVTKLEDKFILISVALIKNEMPKYYTSRIAKGGN